MLINNIRNRALNIKDEDAEYASVRGNENYIDNQQPPITNRISSNGNATNCKESQTSLDFDSSCYTTLNQNRNINEKHSNSNQEKSVDNSNPKRRASNQRNLTLEELELEEFDCHNNQSLIVNPVDFSHSNNILLGKEMENLIDSDSSEDDIVSLNSLIEGDVDEISDSEEAGLMISTNGVESHPPLDRMDSDDLLGEDEELVALSNAKSQSKNILAKDNSDTEADFLEREAKSKSKEFKTAELLDSANVGNLISSSAALSANAITKSSTGDTTQSVNIKDLKDKKQIDKNNSNSNKGVLSKDQISLWQQQQTPQQNIKSNDQQQPLSYNTNSDFDSWSTTSASYTLSEPNSFLNNANPQQSQVSKLNQSKHNANQPLNLGEELRQQKSLKHQPVIRRVSSNSSDSSNASFGQEQNQEGGAPLPIVMQNTYQEQQHAHELTNERTIKHGVSTNTSSSSTSAHKSKKQVHEISKLSSSETLPCDGGIDGGTSGCNIVYESLNPNNSFNKCSDSSDGGKISNDNKSSVVGGKTGKLLNSEKTNLPEVKIENSRKKSKYCFKQIESPTNHTLNVNSDIGCNKKGEPVKKPAENEKKSADDIKGNSSSGKGIKKKVSALIAKFEIPETSAAKGESEIESAKTTSITSPRHPNLRNTRSATPENNLSPPLIKRRPSSSASCYQTEPSKFQQSANSQLQPNPKFEEIKAVKEPGYLKTQEQTSIEKEQKGPSGESEDNKKHEGSNKLAKQQAGKLTSEEEELPLGAEAIDPDNILEDEDPEEMASTVRRNSGGYTSYVFIGSSDAQAHTQLGAGDNETSSVVSGAGSHRSLRSTGAASSTTSSNKIVVNVKDSGVGNTSSGCVVLQDGRASNISIVSTESSELDLPNSPEVTQDLTHPPPDLPAKIRSRNGGVISSDFVAREPGPMSPSWEMRHDERSRGGGDPNDELLRDEEEDFVDEADFNQETSRDSRSIVSGRNGHSPAGYFSSSMESPSASPSRRGRPPVIRAAERHNRLRQQSSNGQNGEYSENPDMVPYEDGTYYHENAEHQLQQASPRRHAHSNNDFTNEFQDEYGDEHLLYNEEGAYDPQMQYGLEYEHDGITYRHHRVVHSGDEEDDVEYVDEQGIHEEAYPMCQPVMYDSNDEYMDGSEGEHLSGDDEYFDREEELRGYNRQIDFTLHTILEESCEDSSDPELRSRSRGSSNYSGSDDGRIGRKQSSHKRHSGPSEMEKYFLYGVGGLPGNDTDEFPPDYSDSAGTPSPEQIDNSNRISKNIVGSTSDGPKSMDAVTLSDRERITDDSGSVGSESDGQCSPLDPKSKKKKFLPRSKGRTNSDSGRLSDSGTGRVTGESDNADGDLSPNPSSSDSEHLSGYDNAKQRTHKKNCKNVAQSQRTGETTVQNPLFNQAEAQDGKHTLLDGAATSSNSLQSPRISPPITPLPSQIIEVQPVLVNSSGISPNSAARASPAASSSSGSSENNSLNCQSSSLSGHPVRKNQNGSSRDSGFVGSMDDLLRNDLNQHIGGSSGGDSGHSFSDSEGHLNLQQKTSNSLINTNATANSNKRPTLEKLSEMSGENTEEDITSASPNNSKQMQPNVSESEKKTTLSNRSSNKSLVIDKMQQNVGANTPLVRKNSFNNWSSDEDTNIMMNRMRAFFRNVIKNAMDSTHPMASDVKDTMPTQFHSNKPTTPASKLKPPQLIAFEEQLTKLMRTVPGINEGQVKEVVEYLSSEDTWSESCDSSDYASSDIDLETYGIPAWKDDDDDHCVPDLEQSWLQEQISASCHEIVQNFDDSLCPKSISPSMAINETEDFDRETSFMYQKLMAKMAAKKVDKHKEKQSKKNEKFTSSPISGKVMHTISSRLVALMHEVSSSQSDADTQESLKSSCDYRTGGMDSVKEMKQQRRPKTDLRATHSNDSTTSSNSSTNNYAVNSKEELLRLNKTNSKSEELLDNACSRQENNVSGKTSVLSSDYNVWKGVNRDEIRRGSLGLPSRNNNSAQGSVEKSMSGSSSGVSDLVNDDERWSWKGSFESALAPAPTDQNTKRSRSGSSATMMSNEQKKRHSGSTGAIHNSPSIDKSNDHMDEKIGLRGVDRSQAAGNSCSKRASAKTTTSRGQTHKDIDTPAVNCGQVDEPLEAEIVPAFNSSKVQSARYRNSNRAPMYENNVGGGPPTTYKSTATATLASPSNSSISSSNTTSTQNMGSAPSARHHSTNSLPRLGTSAITQKRSTKNSEQGTGMMTPRTVSPDTLPAGHLTSSYKPSTIITTTAAVTLSTSSTSNAAPEHSDMANQSQLKSARYRPPGYRPSPSRKTSASSRKTSADSTGSSKYTGKEHMIVF